MVQPLWNTVWWFLKKIKYRITVWSNNATSGCTHKRMKVGTQRDLGIPMFTAAWFSIVKTWKHLRCPSMDERINKMWSTHTMEYYSALKKEGNSGAGYNTDESWRHYVHCNKPVAKGQILYDSVLRRYLEQSDSQRKKTGGWIQKRMQPAFPGERRGLFDSTERT